MDTVFGILGWAIIAFAAIYIPYRIKKSKKAAKEEGYDTVAVVSKVVLAFDVDDYDRVYVKYMDENDIEHEALLHSGSIFEEGTKLRIRYSDQDYLNVFIAEDLELE